MFRFSIRDILWLTVVIALVVSWRIDHHRIDATVAALQQQARKDEHKAQLLREALEDERAVSQAATAERQRTFRNTIRMAP